MATVEELIRQYQTDEALQKEVADILAAGKYHSEGFPELCEKTQCEDFAD